MSKTGKTGVTTNTPKNIMFGAGTIHKNLVYAEDTGWNFDASIIGATNGGSTLSIVPEITKIEADGAVVAAKGLTVKTGETATMEINFIELTKDIITSAVVGQTGTSEDATNYDLIESKANIEENDYLDNVAFVGKTLEGKNIIVILENALCTSGLELGTANKEGTVATVTFECHAELASDLDSLPYKIYYPKAA